MKIESATFFVDDYRGRHYKIEATKDVSFVESIENNVEFFSKEDSLECGVYRCIGNDVDMIYEDECSAYFSLFDSDCNCDDEKDVELYIQSMFRDKGQLSAIYLYDEYDGEEDDMRASELLEEYRSAVTLEQFQEVSSKMAEFIEDIFLNRKI